jgi:hypothetical protein
MKLGAAMTIAAVRERIVRMGDSFDRRAKPCPRSVV